MITVKTRKGEEIKIIISSITHFYAQIDKKETFTIIHLVNNLEMSVSDSVATIEAAILRFMDRHL